jgi:hypothetical protein
MSDACPARAERSEVSAANEPMGPSFGTDHQSLITDHQSLITNHPSRITLRLSSRLDR